MKLSVSIKPISYFKAHAAKIIRRISENQESMVITQNGRAIASKFGMIFDSKQINGLQIPLKK